MTTTPGYEEFTHKECNARIVELEEEITCLRERLKECENRPPETGGQEIERLRRQLGEGMKVIAEKDQTIERLEKQNKELNKQIEDHVCKTSPNWMEQIKAFFKMLDEKRYGPAVEHGLSILAGSLLGYGIK